MKLVLERLKKNEKCSMKDIDAALIEHRHTTENLLVYKQKCELYEKQAGENISQVLLLVF